MWLLSTSRAELYYFVSPESVPGGYAILSHVWGDPPSEQSFQSIRALRTSCTETGLNPRDHVSDKIRECCKLAERYGHDWLWVDTCCIDKTSSTELSEAVNSMFRYYSLANVCYAFLADVPTADISTLSREKSSFRASRWHKRGWTLQELLAPAVLFFVSGTWEILGSKGELSDVLEQVTRVPAEVLLKQEKFSDTSVAQRMSWAAGRETTRPEDEAYCLMGIFGVSMPTLYGEGRRAFRRLQQEIMKQCVDTSLFAWGNTPPEAFPDLVRIDPLQLGRYRSGHDTHDVDACFFANSPSDFAGAAGTRCALIDPSGLRRPRTRSRLSTVCDVVLAKASESRTIPDLPTFEITPYGVRAHVPLLQIEHLQMAILFSYQDNQDLPHQQHLALLLSTCSAERNPILESFPLYCVGFRIKYHQTPQNLVLFQPRMALLEGDLKTLRFYGRTAKWTDIYIRDDPLPESAVSPATIAACLRSGDEINLKRYLWLSQLLRVNSHFHFAWDSMGHLLRRGYSLTLFQPQRGSVVLEMKEAGQPGIWIVLGRCRRRDADADRGKVPAYPHWVRLILRPYGTDPLQSTPHDCKDDHISDWAGMERTFKYYDSHGFHSIKLSFTSALDDVLKIRVSPIKSIHPFAEDLLSAFPDPPRDRRYSGLGKLMVRWHST